MNYNRKCIGCGNYLSSNKESISYVKKFDDDIKYCIRCFKLKNYGFVTKIEDDTINEKLNNIDFKDNMIIMILDLFDLENSIIYDLKNKSNILIVINKLDSLPKKFNLNTTLNNINKILKEKEIYPIDVIIYDAIKRINIKKIMNYIYYATENRKKIYFVGKTNSGKSSLINALLKLNDKNEKLVCSPIKNTTLDLIKIEIDNHILIDTPGYENNNSIINNIHENEVKKIFKNNFNSNSFSIIKKNQLYFIEKLFGILINDFDEKKIPSIVFYKSSYIKINRMKKERMNNFILNSNSIDYNKKMNFNEKKIKLDSKNKYSIFASGICLIVIKNVSDISIFCPKEINFSITKNSII